MSDFVHFYLAGKMTISPERNLFYLWEAQKHFLTNITHGILPVEDFYTPYLPIVFLMMVPYSLLPINYAHLLFDAVNLCIGLAGCFMVIRYFHWTDNKMAKWVLLGALASLPCAITWLLGQISWLYVGLICFYLISMLKNRDIPASLALFLTIIKPQYAMFLLIPACCLKRFRLLFYAAGWGILFFILCGFVFSWKAMIAYPIMLNQNESSLQSVHTQAMYNIRPYLELFLSKPIAYYSCLVLWMLAFLFLMFIAARKPVVKDKEPVFIWLMSVLILASLLFSPHTYSHDVILLVIPALLTLPNKEPGQQSLDIIIWRSIFYFLPVISWLCYLLVCLQLPGNLIFTVMTAVLFICGLRYFQLQLLKR